MKPKISSPNSLYKIQGPKVTLLIPSILKKLWQKNNGKIWTLRQQKGLDKEKEVYLAIKTVIIILFSWYEIDLEKRALIFTNCYEVVWLIRSSN